MSIELTNYVYHTISLFPSNMNEKRILDIGSGAGYWGWIIKLLLGHESYIVGIDVDVKRVSLLRRFLNMYNSVWLIDLREYVKHIPDNEFDIIIMSHVIEHIPYNDGLKVIEHLKRISKGIIIIPYPEGDNLKRGKIVEDRPYHDCHNSIWSERDFRRLGFKTKLFKYSSKAGRAVSYFECFWFWLKGVKRKGYAVAWLKKIE